MYSDGLVDLLTEKGELEHEHVYNIQKIKLIETMTTLLILISVAMVMGFTYKCLFN